MFLTCEYKKSNERCIERDSEREKIEEQRGRENREREEQRIEKNREWRTEKKRE
jgi:hypothetical protein